MGKGVTDLLTASMREAYGESRVIASTVGGGGLRPLAFEALCAQCVVDSPLQLLPIEVAIWMSCEDRKNAPAPPNEEDSLPG